MQLEILKDFSKHNVHNVTIVNVGPSGFYALIHFPLETTEKAFKTIGQPKTLDECFPEKVTKKAIGYKLNGICHRISWPGTLRDPRNQMGIQLTPINCFLGFMNSPTTNFTWRTKQPMGNNALPFTPPLTREKESPPVHKKTTSDENDPPKYYQLDEMIIERNGHTSLPPDVKIPPQKMNRNSGESNHPLPSYPKQVTVPFLSTLIGFSVATVLLLVKLGIPSGRHTDNNKKSAQVSIWKLVKRRRRPRYQQPNRRCICKKKQ